MPHKPDTRCAGTCGRLLWSSTTSLPAGERRCRPCRREARRIASIPTLPPNPFGPFDD